MDFEITETRDNQLFARRDVSFMLKHPGEPTPARKAVRELLAAELGMKGDSLVVDHMESATGMGATRGKARAYKNADAARANERTHFLKRNGIPEKA